MENQIVHKLESTVYYIYWCQLCHFTQIHSEYKPRLDHLFFVSFHLVVDRRF